ncbi:unnamed protein product [Didymodactylos carnosus]|uniref:TIR domain-containing protein n=1 Tax=Didymodactylos carnosus TaxID=1234261 RepID=A0A814FIQ5_9BILA|nr:unnamed protein product [Didymodactylos carnosus]CAF0985565.1 unnamed protein product [Didymodactylos carnosus]CAF3561853.1 unnamed protein product [Didymodactylos carnosus]CAF3757808.1 unnamed protein product [Didymodactylos carnosus]
MDSQGSTADDDSPAIKETSSSFKKFHGPQSIGELKRHLYGDKQWKIAGNSIASVTTSVIPITVICNNLSKNWQTLLNFSYNTNDKERNEVTSLVYIIQTIVDISKLLDSDSLLLLPAFNRFVRLLSRIAMLPIVDETLKNDAKCARDTFYQLFHLLDSSPHLMKYLTHAYEWTDKEQFLDLPTRRFHNTIKKEGAILYETLLYVIFYTSNRACMFTVFEENDLDSYPNILKAFVRYIDHYLKITASSSNIPDIFFNTIPYNLAAQENLSLTWNLVDKTVIVPAFVAAGYPKAVLEWIQIPQLKVEHRKALVSIIHNIARDAKGAIELRKEDGVTVLERIQKEVIADVDESMHVLFYMAYTLLAREDQIEQHVKLENPLLRNIFTNLLINAITACFSVLEKQGMSQSGFHLSELLVVLEKLFVSDVLGKYLLDIQLRSDASTVINYTKTFADTLVACRGALTDGDKRGILACESLINIIWSISFYNPDDESNDDVKKQLSDFRSNLKSHPELILVLQGLKDNQNDAAKCILWNLNPEQKQISDPVLPYSGLNRKSTLKPEISIWISASGTTPDLDICSQLVNALKKNSSNQYVVLVNNDDTSWEKITETIDEATIVLFLATDDYYTSRYCRQAAIYTTNCNKPFILLWPYQEKHSCMKGWLKKLAGKNADPVPFRKEWLINGTETIQLVNDIFDVIAERTSHRFETKRDTFLEGSQPGQQLKKTTTTRPSAINSVVCNIA